MERIAAMAVCLQARKSSMRKAAMMENRESISSGEKANNMKIKAQEE
jgi:hypothetical protein